MRAKQTKEVDNEELPVAEAQPSYVEWVNHLIEGLLGTEKKWFELVSEQNAVALKAIREGVGLYRTGATPPLANWPRQGLDNLLETQRKWLDNIAQQSKQLFNQTQEAIADKPVTEGDTPGGPIDPMRQQLDAILDIGRRWLDFAGQQNTQFNQGLRDAFGAKEPSTPANVTNWSQQMMDNYLETQKRWLDFLFPALARRSQPA